jgi:hypothetical protein
VALVLPKGFIIGKVLLFSPANNEFNLAANSAADFEYWVQDLELMTTEQILNAISTLPSLSGFDSAFGFHKQIPHSGKVYGGGIAVFLNSVLYINSFSQAYGPMQKELVLRALKGTSFQVYLGSDLL